jgi:hypothetical protein
MEIPTYLLNFHSVPVGQLAFIIYTFEIIAAITSFLVFNHLVYILLLKQSLRMSNFWIKKRYLELARNGGQRKPFRGKDFSIMKKSF